MFEFLGILEIKLIFSLEVAVTVRVVVGGTVVVVTDLGRAFAGDKPHAPFEKERSSIAMSPYILLPTMPSMITCSIFESFHCQ